MKKGKKIWKKEMRSSRLLALCMAAVLLFTLPESLPGLYAQESTCRIRLPRQEGVRYQYEEKRVTLEENGGQDLYLEYTPGERVELQILTEGSLERAEFFGTEQSPWKTFETGRISFTMPDQDLELQVTWNREESERTDQVSKQEPGMEPGTALELGLEETGSGSELAMEQKPETEREPGAAIASGTGEKTEMGSNAGKETELEGNTQSRPEQEADSEERAETEQKGSTASETEPGTNTEEGEETEGSTEADSEPEVDTEEEAETETEGSTEAQRPVQSRRLIWKICRSRFFIRWNWNPWNFAKDFFPEKTENIRLESRSIWPLFRRRIFRYRQFVQELALQKQRRKAKVSRTQSPIFWKIQRQKFGWRQRRRLYQEKMRRMRRGRLLMRKVKIRRETCCAGAMQEWSKNGRYRYC